VGVEWAGEAGSLVCPPKKNLTTIGVSEPIRHHFQTLDTEALKQMDREDEEFKGTAPFIDKVCCLYITLNYPISTFLKSSAIHGLFYRHSQQIHFNICAGRYDGKDTQKQLRLPVHTIQGCGSHRQSNLCFTPLRGSPKQPCTYQSITVEVV
jgi:hypothetical protein